MVVRSQKEGENIVIRLHTPEDPLSTGEELLLLHRPKRLAQSTPASSLIGATPSTMMSARVRAKSDLKMFFRFVFMFFASVLFFYGSAVLYLGCWVRVNIFCADFAGG